MSSTGVSEPTEQGRELRRSTPRSSHADWAPAPGRPDPVALLEEQNESRGPWLVPIRHSRMSVSPFTFYRGAARIMASDLATTPSSGFDRPARRRCAPVELRRLRVAGAAVGVRPERLRRDAPGAVGVGPEAAGHQLRRRVSVPRPHGEAARSVAAEAVRSYREAMARFADQSTSSSGTTTSTWRRSAPTAGLAAQELEKRLERFRRRATRKTSQHALEKLAEVVDGKWRIRYDPPVLFPLDHLPGNEDQEVLRPRS